MKPECKELNWITKVRLSRYALAKAVTFKGKSSDSYKEEFETMLYHTDEFHPFGEDEALVKLNEDALYIMFCAMTDMVKEYFTNPMNHAPGYVAPKQVVASPDVAYDIFVTMLDKEVA